MTRRRAALRIGAALGAIAVVWTASCSELGVPKGGVYAISPLQLPSPGVVAGDTMRDSLGVAAPLRVVAFASNGDTVAGTTATFVMLDTFAHLSGGTMLVGDYVGKAAVLGGIGTLQTLPETVKVTLSPDTLYAADSTHHVKNVNILTDSLATSAELSTRVSHKVGVTLSDVDAVIVKYTILSAPPAKGAIPTIQLVNGTLLSSRDTTLSGKAGRSVRLRVNELTSANKDSAIIRATASHRGVTIGTVTFTVVFNLQ